MPHNNTDPNAGLFYGLCWVLGVASVLVLGVTGSLAAPIAVLIGLYFVSVFFNALAQNKGGKKVVSKPKPRPRPRR